MKIIDVSHRSVPISRYSPNIAVAPALDTTIVAVVSDHHRDGSRLVGYGFASIGRFAQGGLIQERFAPRLLRADPRTLLHDDLRAIDPLRCWNAMMAGEKPGGHGERCVAVGALDMALWDLAAKTRGVPLHRLLRETFGRGSAGSDVAVYAGGGYYFPSADIENLRDEMQYFRSLGFTSAKIKIGALALGDDCKRIDTAIDVLGDETALAIDAMNTYTPENAPEAVRQFAPYGLRWFEDICDPLDFETLRQVASSYQRPVSTGEAIFSTSDARNVARYAGLRAGHDVLTFDPAHCYGIPEFVRIIELFEHNGWSAGDFQPHGGHLYSLHLTAGLGLGGTECNPHNFQPFGGFTDGTVINAGRTSPPDLPGIGFEGRRALIELFRSLH